MPRNSKGHNTIQPKYLSTFINSLRKDFIRKGHTRIKYLGQMEYGCKTGRPHYHICFFNLPLEDLEFLKKKKGNPYYYKLSNR